MTVTPRCRVCKQNSHAKWHDLAKCPLNPVALVEWIEALPPLDGLASKARIIGYILGVTGIDHYEMRRALAQEEQSVREER